MRVLLIEPPFSPNQVHVRGFGLAEPLSLEVLAANLKDHDVRILDMRLDDDMERELNSFNPQVVGAGCYATGLYITKEIFARVKQWSAETLTVAGGHHASLIPEDFLDPAIDVIVVGEGEITLRELVEAHEQRKDLRQVAGLAIRKTDGSLEKTGRRPLVDLDTMPWPDRTLVAANRKNYFRGSWRPITSITTERGCPFRCSFCSMWKVNEGKYRVRSPQSVVDEIASIESKYIDFIDDNTLHDVKRARAMYELLKQQGIDKFYKAYARSDTIVKHPDVIEKWREVGLKIVLVGLESFRDKDLQAYGKRNTIANNEAAIRILQANDVEICSYFVVNPNYTEDDFRALGDYVERWNLSHPIFTVLTPLPGTDLYYEVRDRLLTDNYEYYDFFHSVLPTRLPEKEFYRCFAELWQRACSFKNLIRKLGKGDLSFSLSQVLGFREFMRDLKALAM